MVHEDGKPLDQWTVAIDLMIDYAPSTEYYGAALLQVNPSERCLLCIKKDGTFYDMTNYRSEYAWTFGETFRRVVVRRDSFGFIEVFVDGERVFQTGSWMSADCGSCFYSFFLCYGLTSSQWNAFDGRCE